MLQTNPPLCQIEFGQWLGIYTIPSLAQTAPMKIFLLIVLVLTALVLWLAQRQRREALRRQRVISQLLDAADALETRLRAARGEIEAIAGDHVNPVRAAMQDLLQQRLWLQEHAQRASVEQLESVRQALDGARARLDLQLQRVEQARGGQ